ncbi:MAG: Asp-tRNA(Asn)/Glu-tRNA(Gln) amidotransferase subunit GatB [Neisseriaceae bacterium]|nr:MAG: Asp-tRNA(Asn)/Glu-tRNA(Gln) amidotransferase subunit GatB [Neisseriaceae bacterium]
MNWETVIGLEIHVQLNTQSKIFSGSSTAFGVEPNIQANVVDLAMPGSLPVVNKEVVNKAIKLGLALEAKINSVTMFDRKNYFYPDLPKAYQISQLTYPIAEFGRLNITLKDGSVKTINVTRAHMEENAGKSIHDLFDAQTAIDFNRAGTPLIEVVSEPEMHSAEEAVAYAKALHTLVTWLDICDGDMSQGSFRVDVNVSVRPKGQEKFGTRCEIKNLNSFRYIEQAINYEARRQIEMNEDGIEVTQETRLFDPIIGETRTMRTKEDAHDYRYFPDPDLNPIQITEEMLNQVKAEMPELPHQMKARFMQEYSLSEYDAYQVTSSKEHAEFFEKAVQLSSEPKLIANWMNGELSACLNKENLSFKNSPISVQQLADLVERIADGTLSSKLAKKVFEAIWNENLTVDMVIERDGLKQISDACAIEAMIDEVLSTNQKSVEEYQAGKEKALNALVGQVMRLSKGKANPAQVQKIIKEKIS